MKAQAWRDSAPEVVMAEMKASIGRIVIFEPSETDTEARHNSVREVPAIIVSAWSDECVNLKVLTDGPTDLWRTSVQRADVAGEGASRWRWPERV